MYFPPLQVENSLHDALAAEEVRRSWWHGFWWGALCSIAWMALAFTVDVWLKH